MSKKLIFIGNSLKTMINFRGELIEELAARGNRCLLICPTDCEYNSTPNVTVINAPLEGRDINLWMIIKSILSIYKNINSIDTIFAYSIKPIIISKIASLLKGARINIFFIGLGGVFLNKRYLLIKYLCKAFFRFLYFDSIIALNRSDKVILEEITRKEVLILKGEGLPRNISNKEISHVDFPRGKVFTVLRAFKDKGVNEFLDTISELRKHQLDVEVLVFGFNEREALLKLGDEWVRRCNKLNVALMGYDSEFLNNISGRDIFILNSPREGLSRTVMEMVQLKVPIIAYDVPGVSDILMKYSPEMLFQFNHNEAMAKKISSIIELPDDDFVELASSQFRSSSEFFTISEVVDFYERII
ncbi:hypothetical protein MADA3029_270052 [Vibrio nigripulchritudo MADA3029]|uniref:glycosyltransferase n=1 Tax=Vibrio nigripulchritudo TaxID=28173 RepID=UPI0003B223D2|nr:glycosyltransferase [Vibrio nigripulchritudo]CCN47616.1 hypothetical protein VIBNIMADA3020_420052 [Vibrio nigripulchritudo MADA3020]CCN56559.1 hypothetical protein VIBNIMADA3021_970054 [Vibrio nigripulchritudo MADA3021]CCN58815.1 hypothetical protein MADA3029_270052 [Vibrio nigripulchritudo MADA3029]